MSSSSLETAKNPLSRCFLCAVMFSCWEKGESFSFVLCISYIRTLILIISVHNTPVVLLQKHCFPTTPLPIVPSKHVAFILLTLLKIVPLLFIQCSSFGSFESILRKPHIFIGVHTETRVSLSFLCNTIKYFLRLQKIWCLTYCIV